MTIASFFLGTISSVEWIDVSARDRFTEGSICSLFPRFLFDWIFFFAVLDFSFVFHNSFKTTYFVHIKALGWPLNKDHFASYWNYYGICDHGYFSKTLLLSASSGGSIVDLCFKHKAGWTRLSFMSPSPKWQTQRNFLGRTIAV